MEEVAVLHRKCYFKLKSNHPHQQITMYFPHMARSRSVAAKKCVTSGVGLLHPKG
jgi:hypothetical protein